MQASGSVALREMHVKAKAYAKNIAAMTIFGTIGLFVRIIPIPSSELALARTLLGSGTLILVMLFTKQKPNLVSLRKNLPLLIPAGILMGFNWVMLFEAYRNTTVSVSTLMYYCAPVIVILLSPVILKEKLTAPKLIGVGVSMFGMILVNKGPIGGANPLRGVVCALMAAMMYAGIVIINKLVKGLSGLETTLIQLLTACAVLLVYDLITLKGAWVMPRGLGLSALLAVGLIHTGLAYLMYFSSAKDLEGQSLAMCSYIDPFVALMLSALFLGERMAGLQIVGAVMILAGAAFGELCHIKKEKTAV